MSATAQIGVTTLIGAERAEVIFSRFKAKHPEVPLEYREGCVEELQNMFKLRQADLIIVPHDTDFELDADILRLPLMLEQLFFIPRFSERSRWEAMECVTVSDIAAEAFVLLPDNCGLTRTTRHLFHSQGHAINAYERRATGYQSMLDFVDASLCSVTLPESKIRDYPGTVIPIVDNGRPVAIEYIVFGQASNLPRKKFTELWDCLLESKLTVTRPSPCSTTPAFSGIKSATN